MKMTCSENALDFKCAEIPCSEFCMFYSIWTYLGIKLAEIYLTVVVELVRTSLSTDIQYCIILSV